MRSRQRTASIGRGGTRAGRACSSIAIRSTLPPRHERRRSLMAGYKLISADSHIVEPPDMYAGRIEPKFRDRAPKMERRKTPNGREYDAWVIDGMQVGTLGAMMQAGQRFEDPSQIDFLGVWEDVRKGGYDAHSMIAENEQDGVWGSCLQPSHGLFWYRITDGAM